MCNFISFGGGKAWLRCSGLTVLESCSVMPGAGAGTGSGLTALSGVIWGLGVLGD